MTHKQATLPVSTVLGQIVPYMLAALVLLALTFVVPGVNPYRPPLMDMTGFIAIVSYYLTLSGAGNVAPITSLIVCLYVALRPGLTIGQKVKQFLTVFLIVFVFMRGWMMAEVALKDSTEQPRPIIWQLAHEPAGAPSLQMPIESFYQLSPTNPNERRVQLEKVLTPEFTAIAADPRIREHWTGMADYGFPSGHSVVAMMNLVFALAMSFSYLSKQRMWFPYLLFAYGVAVCYSRPIMREHSPTQVLVGGMIGMTIALAAFVVSRYVVDKFITPAESRTERLQARAS